MTRSSNASSSRRPPRFDRDPQPPARFNQTLFDHEFVIGDEMAQRMHAAEMAAASMRDDSHAVSVPAGETRELLCTFDAAGDIEIAGHVQRHYEAGMHAAVTIIP